MANSDTNTTHPICTNVGYGAGPWKLNSGQGKQFNHTISGDLSNSQYNATVQHFHGVTAPNSGQADAQVRRAIFLTDPTIERDRLI
jgi:hypothetical protein